MKKTIIGIIVGLMASMAIVSCDAETSDGKQAEEKKNEMKGGMVPEGGAVNPENKDSGGANVQRPQ